MNSHPVLDMELRPKDEALTPPQGPNIVALIERLAANPDFDVTKLQQLIDMQERIIASQAKTAFTAAFAAMQSDLPVIVERAKTNNGRYAPLEDIIEVVRPILAKHGFSLSHRTEWPDKGTVKVVGILAHCAGHERTSEFISAADTSGSKNAIQGLGSAVAYGRRYTTKDVLNIVTRDEDDDARRGGALTAPDAPKGFEAWVEQLETAAAAGLPTLQQAWKESKPEFRAYMQTHRAAFLAGLKHDAKKVQA
jgi:hypothetical protein